MKIAIAVLIIALLAFDAFLIGHDQGFTLGYHVGYGDRDLGYPEGYSLEERK